MAYAPLPIAPPPGVVLTESNRVIEGRWSNSSGVRFVRGRPQKRGGNVNAVTQATSGVPRAIHAWRDNSFNNFLAAGTYRKLYVYDSSWVQNDVTPLRDSGTLGANPFTTVSGSSTVTVHDVSHGVNVGDTVIFSGASTFNNVTMNGTFLVTGVTTVDDYTVTATTVANASGSGGGAAVAFQYEIAVGTELGSYGAGWGTGSWGTGTWGTPRSGSTIYFEPRIWSLDHFGQILIASYNGGSIYTFDPTVAQPWPRAAVIAAAPTDCRAVAVTPERFVFALRAGMNVSWCTQGDYTIWTPASNNTASTRTLTEGTKLVGIKVLAPFQTLVWSDGAVFMFQWTGDVYVYRSSLLGRDCGLISPNAAVTVDGVAYWMGTDNFWMWNGSVQPIPNVEDIRKYVFSQLDTQTLYQAHAVYFPGFHQVEFYFTATGMTTPTLSVGYDIATQCWWPDSVYQRASSTHFTQGDTRPYLGGSDGFIYQHENTNDDNGSILPWSLTLAPYAIQEGMNLTRINAIQWDFFQLAGTVTATLNGWDRITDGSSPVDTEVQTIDTSTGLSDARLQGRYLGFTIEQSELGSYMRFGKPAAFAKSGGRRR